ncbi:hypothetical protein CCH79_00019688 [Gambusia affinis]|uniref:Collagen alpha-1(XII) chain n=1 Tax=Gambusia affinis TaxID=33528 RepID=A0A315W8R4_GAMAF|nr:hypothetical protein CCH79_00019688 [Gambusia affinis]
MLLPLTDGAVGPPASSSPSADTEVDETEVIDEAGVHHADEEEMRLMASTPYSRRVFAVANFEQIQSVQKDLIGQMCSSVEDQLDLLVSGEEVVDPASNLRVLELASKSMRVSWDASGGDISGYRVQMIPMMAGSKQQDLYLASTQTSVVVRDLSPDTVYQVNVFAMKDLMSSEPVTVMQKTEPVKVSLECSLGVDVQADVVLLVDGSYSIGVTNFAKVRAFLEVLVNTFDIGPNKVQIALVQYSRDSYTEFYLNTHQDVNTMVKAVRTFPYRGGSTNTGRAMTYVREKIFQTSRGARANVPRVTILITDGKSSDAFKDPATKLRNADVEIFAVGVKDAVRSELEAIANDPAETHVYTVEDFDAFQRISKELTQSICLRIEQEIRSIFQRPRRPPEPMLWLGGNRCGTVTTSVLEFSSGACKVKHVHVLLRGGLLAPRGMRVRTVVQDPPVRARLPPSSASASSAWNEERFHMKNLFQEPEAFSGSTRENASFPVRPNEHGNGGEAGTFALTGDVMKTENTLLEAFTPIRFIIHWPPEGGAGLLWPPPTQKEVLTPPPLSLAVPAFKAPRNLQTSEPTKTSFRVSWDPAPGDVRGYRVTFHPSGNDVDLGELMVGPYDNTVVLEELRYARLQVFGSFCFITNTAGCWLFVSSRNEVTSSTQPDGSSQRHVGVPRVLVDGEVTTTVLENLTPLTQYVVNVFAVLEGVSSEPLKGTETTCECSPRFLLFLQSAAAHTGMPLPPASNLKVYDETSSSMRVSWEAAAGASGYLLLYRSINASEPQEEQERHKAILAPTRTQNYAHLPGSHLDRVGPAPLSGSGFSFQMEVQLQNQPFKETEGHVLILPVAPLLLPEWLKLTLTFWMTFTTEAAEVRVAGGVTNTQLLQLIPNTQYAVTLLALHGEATSEALEGRGVTCT